MCLCVARCIYNETLEDAIKSHGKTLVHTGSGASFEPPSSTVDSIRHEDADQTSVREVSEDRGSLPGESISRTPGKSKPVFSVMADEARPHTVRNSSQTVRAQKTSVPPGFEAEPPERGINYIRLVVVVVVMTSPSDKNVPKR